MRLFRTLLLCSSLAALAACGRYADEQAGEFADAVAVLDPADQVLPDLELAGQAIDLPAASFNTDWTQVGGNAGHAPGHLVGPEIIDRAWRARGVSSKAKGAPISAPPVVDTERLYTIDAVASIQAFDVADGERVWQTTLTPDVRDPKVRFYNIFGRVNARDLGFGGGAAVQDGQLFVTSGFGFIASLDAATGEILWKVDTASPMRNPPTVSGGLVIAVSISNQVYALDAQTGEEVWTFESFEEPARVIASAAPAVQGESIVVPFSSGEIVSLNLSNGRVNWQAVISRTSRLNALSVLGDIAGSPVADRGAVFSVSQSGQMVGIDLRTGAVAWEQPVGGSNTPWVAGETIFVLSNQGTLSALNRIDGRVRWVVELPTWRNERREKGRSIWAGPVLASGRLYLTSTGGEMIAVAPQTGEIVDRYRLGEAATQPPIVAAGTIYVMTEDGVIHAFRDAAL